MHYPMDRLLFVAIEGLRGAGKSTQVALLKDKLNSIGIPFTCTEWNSDPIVSDAIRAIKANRTLSPIDHCLLHAADFFRRYERELMNDMPRLVIFDRYIYTAIARDTYRGIPEEYVKTLYGRAVTPDSVLYLEVSPEITLKRKLDGVTSVFYYGNGQDVQPMLGAEESFIKYQRYQSNTYKRFCLSNNWIKVDGERSIERVFSDVYSGINCLIESKRIR